MTKHYDHVDEALMLYEAEYGDRPNSLGYETADVQHLLNMLGAQVHATLALVEQQRIANLIAFTTAGEFDMTSDVAEQVAKDLGVWGGEN